MDAFSPGFDFNFDIQPRIQVAHDVSVLRISNPAALDTFEFNINDSINPKATVYNYGVKDQNNPFDVVCEVLDQFDNVVYRGIEVITLDAEDSAVVTFSDKFSLGNYGDLRMRVYTKLSGDQASENDTIAINFSIYVKYDIQVESFFEPVAGTRYELNKDKISPTVRMVNFGSKDQNGIRVTSRIIQDSLVAKTQTKIINLAGGSSQILAFDSVTIPFAGDVFFEVFCWNTIDSFPVNDTARVMVTVIRSNDLGIVSVIRPRDSTIFDRNQVFRPYLNYRNFGLGDQDSVVVTCAISQESGKVIYTDTLIKALPKLSTIQALFKDFKAPDSAQTLYFDAKTWIEGDQDTSNDNIRTKFFIKTKNDLALMRIAAPVKDSLYLLGDTIKPRVLVRNTGNNVVPTTARIFFTVLNGASQQVFIDSVNLNNPLAVDATTWLSFKSFAPTSKDAYRVVVYNQFNIDGEKSNDTLETNFNASLKHSVAIKSVASPNINQVYQLNKDTVKPSFILENTGINDIVSPVYYQLTLATNSNVVYSLSDSITTLLSEATISIQPSVFVPTTTGLYTLKLTIQNVEDEVLTDNEISLPFFVSLRNDVSPISFVFPEIDSLVFANRVYAPKATFKNVGDSAQKQEFSVSYLIDFQGTNRYNSNKNIKLGVGESRTVVFDSTFKPTTPGLYQMMIISRLGTDQVKSNDTLKASFVVDFHSSVSSLQLFGLKVFPNPASNYLSIASDQLALEEIQLFDATGAEVLTTKAFGNKQVTISLHDLSSGYYWLQIKAANQVVWTKIVVE